MQVRFTSSARRQLLEAVAHLRELDRNRALVLLASVEEKMMAVAQYEEPILELQLENHEQSDTEGYRLIYRMREDVVWVVAVFEPFRSCYTI